MTKNSRLYGVQTDMFSANVSFSVKTKGVSLNRSVKSIILICLISLNNVLHFKVQNLLLPKAMRPIFLHVWKAHFTRGCFKYAETHCSYINGVSYVHESVCVCV